MKAVIIIPARYASTRYPGKPLVELRTREGKNLLFSSVGKRLIKFLVYQKYTLQLMIKELRNTQIPLAQRLFEPRQNVKMVRKDAQKQ